MLKKLQMDSSLVLDSQIKVEEYQNFQCIICKDEFPTRMERIKHLEKHFLQQNCKNCKKPVIVIGGLEFELHHPTHCEQNESTQEDVFDGEYLMDDETEEFHGFKDDDEALAENESDIESKPKTIKIETKNKVEVEHSIEENSELMIETKQKRKRSIRKGKRKPVRKCTKSKKKNNSNDNDDDAKTEPTESEDEVIKQMDLALKKLPKTVPCTIPACDAKFGTERTLKIHMNKKHGIKERYVCPICSREFKISGNLKQHVETHSDYKRFICNCCGKGFHLPYNLKEHMNTHSGNRPYKCITCGKTFGRSALRIAHMRVHTGEKPYKCDGEDCDRAYAYKTDLKRHKRSVHGIIDKTFPCHICGKIFYENKFLKKHFNVH